MKKRNVRWISFLVTLLLVFSCVPVQAFALEDEAEVTSPPESAAEEMTTEYVEVVEDEVIGLLAEVVERREENVKHYRMNDGTYQAVVYGSAVHRKDADGAWQDIDNRLYASAVGGAQSFATLDGRVRMAEKFTTEEPLLRLAEEGYELSMTWLPADSLDGPISTAPMTLATVTNAPERAPDNTFASITDAAEIDTRTTVVYADVATGTDLEYILDGNDVKENILVKAKRASYEYAVLLTLSGLTATAEASGAITIADAETGARKYRIPAPYMYDSTGEISYAVAYELTEVKEGLYLLTVTADAEWINDEGRALPVTIDPTLEYEAITFDAYVDSAYPNTNFGFEDILKIGSGKRAYVRMMMPNLPSGASVSGGAFYFYAKSGGSAGSITLYVYRPYMSWEEDTITYYNSPESGGGALDQRTYTLSASSSSATPQRMVLDVSEAIDSWFADEDYNYGIEISGVAGNGVVLELVSYEADEYYPFMTVTYTYDVADGVYAIKVPDMRYYMTINNDSAVAGGILQTRYFANSPATSFNNTGLWKISKVGTNRYVIRSMVNNNLGLSISGTQVVTKAIPANDSAVPTADTFLITWDGRGYRITTGDREYQLKKNGTPGNLTVVDADTATETARWELQMYTGAHRSAMTLNIPASLQNACAVVGTSGTVAITAWSTNINANTCIFDLNSIYCVVQWDFSEGTRILNFDMLDPGSVQGDVILKGSDGQSNLLLKSISFRVIPAEGTFFIQNMGSQCYMGVGESQTVAGSAIQQWTFSAIVHQQWLVEHTSNSDGYVRIKSAYSGLYLGVNPENTTQVKQYSLTDVGSDYTLWLLDAGWDNSSLFICKATNVDDMVLAIPIYDSDDGTSLVQIDYSESGASYSEWDMYQCLYTATVNVYYDKGYCARYNESETVAAENINEYTRKVCERYLQELGLLIEFSSAVYFKTAIDECKGDVTGANIDSMCSCGSNHTNADSMVSNFEGSFIGSNTITNVLWTGHRIALENGDYNRSFSFNHCVYMIMDDNDKGNYRTRNSQGTLMHELAHQYGAPDHYHEEVNEECIHKAICSECGTPPRPRTCLMNVSRQSIYSNSILCNGCKNDIIAHLNSHHILGGD